MRKESERGEREKERRGEESIYKSEHIRSMKSVIVACIHSWREHWR